MKVTFGVSANPAGAGRTILTKSAYCVWDGSSPRVRGRARRRRAACVRAGLIPAGAGQTSGTVSACCFASAHPRWCGADSRRGVGRSRLRGSSPRVRGRPPVVRVDHAGAGLIPAGAGQTCLDGVVTVVFPAHPRGCGADLRHRVRVLFRLGSSPLVRGRLRVLRKIRHNRGLIPVGAGQTKGRRTMPRNSGAHPRRCGADFAGDAVAVSVQGSSPQVRGRLARDATATPQPGLIPAGAGQTPSAPWKASAQRAHPRRCGADTALFVAVIAVLGSSPQVRGRLALPPRWAAMWRLFPAGAGQTTGPQRAGFVIGAHPRRCGADITRRPAMLPRMGSSPQVRGRQGRGSASGR